ncbi:hypothetical protein [Anoxybacillus sp. J5B_2022]|uniref:hypothetical protein n=1 Tax=Anoxybacillus sp. J5B_2022 TaxID=3003246 RepID=UPI002286A877|nr:hypothetical protein [Anoxybacillus sp. J5B_2022]MCZ0756651.1 hypothetical protein [Anoxybacillus sp. J5B_2022]
MDETLAVGDYKFQEKCKNRIEELLTTGTTVLLVSHSSNQIEELCDRVLWLEKGKIKMLGNVQDVMNQYNSYY